MICLEEDLINKYPGIVEVMKFFIDSQRYNLVDRMAFALSPESIEQAIYDALRIVKSLESTKVYAKIKSGDKEYILNCCDYGEGQGPGINGIFVGPSDLSASFGIYGKIDSPKFIEILKYIVSKALKYDKVAGIMAKTPEFAAKAITMGYNFISLSHDTKFLILGAKSFLERTKSLAGL